MRRLLRELFGIEWVHLPKGPLYSEQVRAFGEMEFPDIKPIELPEVKPLTARVVKAKRVKEKPLTFPKRAGGRG